VVFGLRPEKKYGRQFYSLGDVLEAEIRVACAKNITGANALRLICDAGSIRAIFAG
jgi:hypothetical protein